MFLSRCLFFALFLGIVSPAVAQDTETVTNLNDMGAGSLRQAVENQDDDGQNDLYLFTAPSGTITLASDMEASGDDGEIIDLNARNITITGGFRAFQDGGVGDEGGIEINDMAGAAAGTLTLNNATMSVLGTTRITRGTLELAVDERLDDASNLVLAAGGTLRLASTVETIGTLNGVSGALAQLQNGQLTLAGGAAMSFAGVISGTGTLSHQGAGVLTLTGTNSHSGTLVIGPGTVRLGGAGVPTTILADGLTVDLSTATSVLDLANNSERFAVLQGIAGAQITLGTGTITVGNGLGGTTAYSGVISGTGGFTKEGAAYELQLGGASTYDGATTINAGRVTLLASERLDDDTDVLVDGSGTLNLGGFTETIASLSGTSGTAVVALGAGTLITNGDGTTTQFAGVLTGGVGAGNLTKNGAGSLTLTGASTYEGVTSITAGSLRVGASERIDDDSDLVINGSGTFDVNGFSETVASLTSASTNARVTLGAGTLVTNGDDSTTQFAGIVTGGTGTGALIKAGTGVLTLTGANTYEGITRVNGGTLRIAGASERIDDDSDLELDGSGSFDVNGFTETVASLASSSALTEVVLGSGTLVTNGDGSTTQFDGVISGTAGGGALTKNGAGTLTITAANTYEGGTTINDGSLRLGGGNERLDNDTDLVLTGTGTFDLNGFTETVASLSGAAAATRVALGAATLITNGDGSSTTFAGVISGTTGGGSLTKLGAGVLTLTGSSTYEGTTTVLDGVLRLGGADERLDDDTDVVLGAAGTFDLNGFSETIGSLASGAASTRVELGAGTLTTNGDGSTTLFAGVIAGTGSLVKAGAGTLTLSNADLFTGLARVSGGSLALVAGASLDDGMDLDLSTAGATFDLNGNSEQVGTFSGVAGTQVQLDGATFTFGEATDASFAGAFSADGGAVVKVGAGTQSLTGASAHTGGTRLQQGGLRLGNDAALGSGVFTFEDSATNFAESVTAVTDLTIANAIAVSNEGVNTFDTGAFQVSLTGILSGARVLERQGAGTLTLGNAASTGFTGRLDNNAGILALTGGAAYGSTATGTGGIRNEIGATLIGAGSVGVLENNGFLSPGAVNGQRSVVTSGLFVQSATGTFLNDLDPDGTSDRIDATLAADLGGTLALTGDPDRQATFFGRTFTVVRAGSAAGDDIIDSFATVTDNMNFLAPTVTEITDGDGAVDRIDVSFDRLETPLATLAANPNQASVAQAIEQVFVLGQARDDFRQVFDRFFTLDPSNPNDRLEIQGFLQDLAGESRAAALAATLSTNQLVTGRVIGQMDSISFEATAHEEEEEVVTAAIPPPPGRRYFAPPRARSRRPAPPPPEPEPNHQVWVLGAGTSGRIEATDETQASEHDGGGFTVGYTWKPEEDDEGELLWMWGAHAGYQGLGVESPTDLDRTDVDSFHFGIHGRYDDDDDRYANVVMGYVDSELTTRRAIRFGNVDRVARGDSSTNEFFQYGEIGKVYHLGDDDDEDQLHLQPQAAMQYRTVHQDAYTEEGAGDLGLTVQEVGLDSLQSALGLRLFYTERTESGGWLVPEVTLRWGHEFGELERTVISSFVDTSPRFAVNGRVADRDTLQVRAGMAAYTVDDWNLDVSYAGELGTGASNHAGVVRVVCRFD